MKDREIEALFAQLDRLRTKNATLHNQIDELAAALEDARRSVKLHHFASTWLEAQPQDAST